MPMYGSNKRRSPYVSFVKLAGIGTARRLKPLEKKPLERRFGRDSTVHPHHTNLPRHEEHRCKAHSRRCAHTRCGPPRETISTPITLPSIGCRALPWEAHLACAMPRYCSTMYCTRSPHAATDSAHRTPRTCTRKALTSPRTPSAPRAVHEEANVVVVTSSEVALAVSAHSLD